MIKKISIAVIVAIIVVVAYINIPSKNPQNTQIKKFLTKGDSYIPFTLKNLKGKEVSTKDLKDKVIFINFWATWCAPCKKEMPSMQALYDKLNKKYPNQFVMLAVNIDTQDVPLSVQMYALNLKLNFPILLDTDGKIKSKYNTTGVPETFIVDKNGKIFSTYIGSVDWNKPKYYKDIESLLK